MSKLIQTKIGTLRIAVLIPLLNLVIKFPVIRFKMLGKQLGHHLKRKSWESFRQEMLDTPTNYLFGLRGCLLAGLNANWREYRFYKQTHNPFVWPTHFSFFGIINIQKIGKKCGYTTIEVWKTLYRIAGNDLFQDNHCFANSENFCVSSDDKLRLLDYSSEGSQKVVLQYGEQFSTLGGSPLR